MERVRLTGSSRRKPISLDVLPLIDAIRIPSSPELVFEHPSFSSQGESSERRSLRSQSRRFPSSSSSKVRITNSHLSGSRLV